MIAPGVPPGGAGADSTAAGEAAAATAVPAPPAPPATSPRTRGLGDVASRNALMGLVARLSLLVVGMILTPFVLGKLGRELYGVVVAIGGVYEYLSLLRGGVGGALRRFVTLHHHGGRPGAARDFYAAGFWWSGILRTFILLVGLALAWPVCGFLRLPEALRPDAAVGVGLVLLASVVADQANIFSIAIYATGRTTWLSIVSAAGAWGRLALTVVALSLFLPTLRVYGAALLVLQVLSMLALMGLAQRAHVVGPVLPRPQLGNPVLRRELLGYGGLALLSEAASLLYVSTDNLFIGRIYGAASITHYSLGTRWTPLVMGFLGATMSGLTPLFTSLEARGEGARSREALLRVIAIASALAVPVCLVPCMVGDLFLVNWVGPVYRDSYRYMLAMLVPAVIEASLAPVWATLLARGRIGWIATGDIVVAVGNVGISLLLALVFHLGLLGFALGNSIAVLSKSLLLRPIAGRRDGSMPPLSVCLGSLPKALLGSAPGLLLLWLARPLYGGSLAGVIGAGIAGGAICLAGSFLTAVGRAEMRRLRGFLVRAGRP
jgi:Na+-driven multidrug efflux pump